VHAQPVLGSTTLGRRAIMESRVSVGGSVFMSDEGARHPHSTGQARAPQLPQGTVTFLFTDVEGSTTLLRELGPSGYADALARHRATLRATFSRHGGVEVDTQGDAFFVAFADATAALATAWEAQQALKPWPIRVRMGLHSGEPVMTEEGYVGIDVHRAEDLYEAEVVGAASGHAFERARRAGHGLSLDQAVHRALSKD
jgi:class 3 adenylate cyclase